MVHSRQQLTVAAALLEVNIYNFTRKNKEQGRWRVFPSVHDMETEVAAIGWAE